MYTLTLYIVAGSLDLGKSITGTPVGINEKGFVTSNS